MIVPRHVVSVNTVLLALCGVFVVQIVRTLIAPAPTSPVRPVLTSPVAPRITPATGADPAVKSEEPPKRAELTSYASIAAKNLFSPSRSETGAGTPAAPTGPAAPKPWLHGVVVRESGSIAFLEDPSTKRIVAYRVGDTLPAGTVESIAADRVMLTGPAGPVEVRLRDPSKPRPPRTPVATPGSASPARPDVPPVAVPAAPPAGPAIPRPFPPNLLRRTPPSPRSQPGSDESVPPPQPGAIVPPSGSVPDPAAPPAPRGRLPLSGGAIHG
jgi:hypothetical protein